MRRTHGHRDRPGRLQQHLPLGADDGLHPEVNTLPGHRAPEHAGNSGERPRRPVLIFAVVYFACFFTPGQRHPVRRQSQV